MPLPTESSRDVLTRPQVNAPAEPTRLTQPTTTGRRTASAQSAQSASTVDAAEGSDNDENPPSLEALVVSKLKVASYAANATRDYDNSVIEQTNPGTRTAYAKIAGHNWTFFVIRESVTIGRPERASSEHPEHSAAGTAQEDGQDAPDKYTGPKAETEVDIDLGPDRSVSRIHAMIYYDGDRRKWLIRCNGRNGLKLDDNIIHRGAIAELRSGSVISVTGTQMLFILPNVEMELAPVIRTQVGLKSDDESGNLDRDAYMPPRSGPNGENGRGQMTGSHFHDSKDYPAQSPAQHGGNGYNLTSSQAFPATPAAKHDYGKTNSPAYSRGVKMESTEQIDYSLDANKDVKPPFSYAQIIGQAIVSAPDEQISLNDIYEYMRKHFAFYRWSNEKWPVSLLLWRQQQQLASSRLPFHWWT
jgi:forkhead protein FKH